jgi:hypothetical protein
MTEKLRRRMSEAKMLSEDAAAPDGKCAKDPGEAKAFQTAGGKPTNLSGRVPKQRELQQQIQEAEMIVKYTER